ncbi:hypothetical protein A3A39_02735 [Candidatus Kaiserbacteria bacterium RIFCSPLOWO2_01_FULL_54_13]|uniref:Uncharacterized protein n=1 Tax=Candidatus Kaiserbacteria bacterium RIFCSPLOWO2_01_FULL_54_13 TaxID=1798512 RepID=A0A1F6F2L2_9BACT|nr:MAG: hypothetical protein A3A39_02735 [Candidatus Kaiserbacteria bacterium RIFCSPLOWO2_01_FULL_54_13]
MGERKRSRAVVYWGDISANTALRTALRLEPTDLFAAVRTEKVEPQFEAKMITITTAAEKKAVDDVLKSAPTTSGPLLKQATALRVLYKKGVREVLWASEDDHSALQSLATQTMPGMAIIFL